MGTNTASRQSLHYASICCGEFFRPIYALFRKSEIDPFKIRSSVEDLLIDTFERCFNGSGPSLLDVCMRHRCLRLDRTDLMEILVGFEDYIYNEKSLERIRHGSVVDLRFMHDSTILEVTYHETINAEEPESFSRFVRQLRRNGETIHPEVEKLLERYREAVEHRASVQRPGRVSLLGRRPRGD